MLLVDDVHHLTQNCWLALKSLMNFELDSRQPVLLILLGGPQTLRQLIFQNLEEVRDRLSSNYVLKGLQEDEVGPYLDRRLEWAGADRAIFPQDVIVALLVLLWSLGEVAELPWPGSMCDVEAVHELAQRVSNSACEFHPRDVVTILDELERTSRLNWALRHAHQHGQTVPVDLDWNGSSGFVAVSDCPLVGVVQQRHHTLNWLVRFQDAEWDEVDTPA